MTGPHLSPPPNESLHLPSGGVRRLSASEVWLVVSVLFVAPSAQSRARRDSYGQSVMSTPQQQHPRESEFRRAGRQAVVWAINGLGSVGLVLIGYSLLAARTGSRWAVLEPIATTVSEVLTLAGVAITAASVYLPPNPRPPDPFSRVWTAWLTIVGVLLALAYRIYSGVPLPAHLVNGFALLAIAGALFRLVSR